MKYTIRFQRIVVLVIMVGIVALAATAVMEVVIYCDWLATFLICGEDI